MLGHIQDVSTSKFSFFKLYVVDQAVTRVVTRLCTNAEYLRKRKCQVGVELNLYSRFELENFLCESSCSYPSNGFSCR
jgi:hypothetical protein